MRKKNVTFVLTEEVDTEIEIRALLSKKQKSEILIEALREYFTNHDRGALPPALPQTMSQTAANSQA